MNKKQRKLLTYILLAVFLISAALLLLRALDSSEAADSYSAAEALASGKTAITTETTAPAVTEEPLPTQAPEILWIPAPVTDADPYMEELAATDLAALQSVNPDVVGWIRIPDCQINYPILQGEDNEYYLEHTWDKISNYSGSIFLECMNAPDFTDFNTILYGHNMRDGSMFATLHLYSFPDYFAARPHIYIVTNDGVLRYDIFSSYKADVEGEAYGLSFNQVETRESFIRNALEQSVIDTGVVPSVTDRIITLSTCSGWGYETRWVVHARLKMVVQE